MTKQLSVGAEGPLEVELIAEQLVNLLHEAVGQDRIINIGEQTAALLSCLLLTARLLGKRPGAESQRPGRS